MPDVWGDGILVPTACGENIARLICNAPRLGTHYAAKRRTAAAGVS